VRPSEGVARLARHVNDARAEGRTIPLLIGQLCSERAGVPTTAHMGRMAIESVYRQTPEYAEKTFGGVRPEAADAAIETAFLAWLGGMTNRQRYRVLEPFYRQVPVPIYYQDLAALVLAGYFTHLLSTNVDSLLEQALDAVGMRRDQDYQVVVLLPPSEAVLDPLPPAPVSVIKLQGDLLSSWFPDSIDIELALHANRSLIKGELKQDVIVVGHRVAAGGAGIDRWLARAEGDESWWVHPERPDPASMATIEASQQVHYLEGPDGEPESFVGQLATHLLRLPAVRVLSGTGDGTLPGDDLPELPEEVIAQEFYKGRIEMAQVAKYAFQQGTGSGGPSPAMQAQIDYQSERLAGYGTEYLQDEATPEPYEILEQLADEVTAAGGDPSVPAFLRTQAGFVRDQMSGDQPNRLVILATLQAASTVSQSVPATTIAIADLVEQLNLCVLAFAPLGK
jgi:hypothetical protein